MLLVGNSNRQLASTYTSPDKRTKHYLQNVRHKVCAEFTLYMYIQTIRLVRCPKVMKKFI